MQKYIWVLCEELDPAKSWDETKAKNIWTFNDFESAKTALRQLMRTKASTENKVFDGKGGIKTLQDYNASSITYPHYGWLSDPQAPLLTSALSSPDNPGDQKMYNSP